MAHHRKINLSMFRGDEDEEDDLVIPPKVSPRQARRNMGPDPELIYSVASSRIDRSEEQDILSWNY